MSNQTKISHPYVAPHNYRDCFISVLMGDTTLFVGPKGCGKSLTAEKIGHELGTKHFKRNDYLVTRLSLGGYFNPSDLLGEMLLVESPKGIITEYVYGHLTTAVEKGYMLICDEIDCMGPEANSAFQRITEIDGKIIIKTEKGTVEIPKHPHYRLVFTSNTHLTGDSTGMFNGAQVQNFAFKDRINSIHEFDYNPLYEKTILETTYKIPSAVCNALYGTKDKPSDGIINKLREACRNGTIQDQFSMRSIIDFARHYAAYNGPDKNKSHSWHKSTLYCIVNKFPPQYHEEIKSMIGVTIGKEFIPTNKKDQIEMHTDCLKSKGYFPTAETYLPEELKSIYS